MTRLEIIRRSSGFSQKKVATDIGVSPTIISHIESRRRECYPRLRRLLADYFGVEESSLFDGRGMAVEVDPGILRAV